MSDSDGLRPPRDQDLSPPRYYTEHARRCRDRRIRDLAMEVCAVAPHLRNPALLQQLQTWAATTTHARSVDLYIYRLQEQVLQRTFAADGRPKMDEESQKLRDELRHWLDTFGKLASAQFRAAAALSLTPVGLAQLAASEKKTIDLAAAFANHDAEGDTEPEAEADADAE